jgi:NADPH2:quinone reductase
MPSTEEKTSTTMDAIFISKFGPPSVLKFQKVPKPTPAPQEVLIKVKAFGLNHAEMHMRKGEWDVWNPVTGLECVGVVEECPNDEIPVGSKVIGVLGGMGLLRPGSYGEFVSVPINNVIQIDTKLSWELLAAIPLVYATAYVCVFTVLNVQSGESLLIRGATSTIGQAALHLAVDAGIKVTATTRREERFGLLKKMGATKVMLEQDDLEMDTGGKKFDKVLNLIGNRVLVKSINITRPGGRMLQAGWLGGLEPVKDFNPMVEMESGVHFSLYHGKVLGTPAFPFSAIPLQEIIKKIENGAWDAKPAHVFDYEDIHKAHEMLDSHDAGGKIVIKKQ